MNAISALIFVVFIGGAAACLHYANAFGGCPSARGGGHLSGLIRSRCPAMGSGRWSLRLGKLHAVKGPGLHPWCRSVDQIAV